MLTTIKRGRINRYIDVAAVTIVPKQLVARDRTSTDERRCSPINGKLSALDFSDDRICNVVRRCACLKADFIAVGA